MKKTADYLNDLNDFLNNLTDIQLAVLKGKVEEEEKNRNDKKIEEYYNKLADLIDEIRGNDFDIYYSDDDFEISNLVIEVAERA